MQFHYEHNHNIMHQLLEVVLKKMERFSLVTMTLLLLHCTITTANNNELGYLK